MTSYNYTLHAVSATSDFSTVNKKPMVIKSVSSSASLSIVTRVSLILSVISSLTVTMTNVKALILFVTSLAIPLSSRIKAVSKSVLVYTDGLSSCIRIPNKICSVASSVTISFKKLISLYISRTSASSATVVKYANKVFTITSETITYVFRTFNLPGLIPTVVATIVPSRISSITKTFSVSSSVTATFKKWLFKVILCTSSYSATIVSSLRKTLHAVSVVYALGVRVYNLSAILIATSPVSIRFLKGIQIIKNLNSPIISSIVKSVTKPISRTCTVTATSVKKLYSVILASSVAYKYILRGQTFFRTLYPVAVGVTYITTVSYIIRTYTKIISIASSVLPTITLDSTIAQTFYQTLNCTSEVIPSLPKTLFKAINTTVSSVLSFIRSWG